MHFVVVLQIVFLGAVLAPSKELQDRTKYFLKTLASDDELTLIRKTACPPAEYVKKVTDHLDKTHMGKAVAGLHGDKLDLEICAINAAMVQLLQRQDVALMGGVKEKSGTCAIL